MLGISKSVRGTVVATPLIVLAIVAAVVFAVIARMEDEQAHLFREHHRLDALQREAQRFPLLLSEAQNALFKLSIWRSLGVTGPEVESQLDRLTALLTEIETRHTRNTSGIGQDLRQALDSYRTAVMQAITLIDRSPTLGATAIRGTAGLFADVQVLAKAHVELSEVQFLRDMARAEARTQNMNSRLSMLIMAMVATLTAAAFLMAGFITGPVQKLARTVRALQDGDLDLRVPETDRSDELGQVARSIEGFRTSLIENRQLQHERDDLNRTLEAKVMERTRQVQSQKRQLAEAQVAHEADRLQMSRQLRAEFGAVIHSASLGDFTRRVATEFSDRNLAKLAGDVNRLIENVDASICAAQEAVQALAMGTERPPRKDCFTGTFAEMMHNIDETAAKILQQSVRLKHTALHDSLTGLPNRRYLEERLSAEAPDIFQGRHGLALMHIDLDRFKQINDTLGHDAGDRVLTRAATVLQDTARAGDFVARVGGDEFVLLSRYPVSENRLAPSHAARDQIEKIAGTIVNLLAEPIMIEGSKVRFGASVGIAFSGEGRVTPSKLLVEADLALYDAKERGRNQAQVFTPHLQTSVLERKRLADDLHRAFEEDQFVPYFQPQIDTRTGQIVGVEALVRWQHPEKGMVAPAAFVATAHEIGLLPILDRMMLEKAMAAVLRLNADAGTRVPRLSVNVGLDQLTDADYLDIADTARGRGVGLCFELLETIFFDDQGDEFAFTIDGLQERGILIEVDDFGSGRASISSLVRIRPDGLKIDRSLVQSVVHDPRQEHLVGSIIDMARGLDIGVVAEGIETREHSEILKRLGCPVQQGFNFMRPVPESRLRDWLRTHELDGKVA